MKVKIGRRKPRTRVRKPRRRSLRFRAINIIRPDNRRTDAIVYENKDKTFHQFFESVLPYMAVGEYSLTVDKAPVYNAGQDKEVYNLDVKTMSLTRVSEGYPAPETRDQDAIRRLFSEPRYVELNGTNLPLSAAFMFTYTKIFDFFVPNREMVNVLVNTHGLKEYDAIRALKEVSNASVEMALERLKTPLDEVEVNWFDSKYLGLSSNDQRMIKELINTVNDPPLSTITNLLHLFIFINRMPLFFQCIQAIDKQGVTDILKEEFSDEVLAGLYELRSLGYDTHPSAIRNSKVSSKIKTVLPILCSSERSDPPLFDAPECPSSSESAKNKLIDSIDKYGKFIRRLNEKQSNLGYIFILNYWMYRSNRMPIINDRFPLNLVQQLESLKSMTNIDHDYDYIDPNAQPVVTNLVFDDSFRFVETQGVYKGKRYPNCVENAVFKLIQLMLYDPSTKKLNVSHWTSMDEGLKTIVYDINAGNPVNWNLIVCGRRKIAYNEGYYNIKSNVKNVLELLNQLSGNTNYRTLREWVNGVYTNPRSLPLVVMESTIQLGQYLFEIMYGHSSFSSTMDSNLETFIITDDLLPIYSIFKLEKNQYDFQLSEHSTFEQFRRAIPKQYMFADSVFIDLQTVKPFAKNIVTGILRARGISQQSMFAFFSRFNLPFHRELFSENIEIIDLYNDYNQLIGVGVLPSSLKTLKFGYSFNQPIGVGVLPSSLQLLSFGHSFNQPIGVGVLPSSLQSLTLGWNFDQPLEAGVLPESLKTLVFGSGFNRPIGVGVLPSSLESVEFGYIFDQTIDAGVLPETLQYLKFGYDFNKPIGVGVLPKSLQHLIFGFFFNQPLEVGVLPSSLQSLTFGNSFNNPIRVGVLPSSLQSLVFGSDFNQPVERGALPNSLRILNFGANFNKPLEVGSLPDSLQTLTLGTYFDQRIYEGVLPGRLQTLIFNGFYTLPLHSNVLPLSLQTLYIPSR